MSCPRLYAVLWVVSSIAIIPMGKRELVTLLYTTYFSTKYFVMCKVYTNVGGIR